MAANARPDLVDLLTVEPISPASADFSGARQALLGAAAHRILYAPKLAHAVHAEAATLRISALADKPIAVISRGATALAAFAPEIAVS